MQVKWIIGLVAIWIVGALFSGIGEGIGVHPDEESAISILMNSSAYEMTDVFGVISLPVPNTEWLSAFAQIFTWDFAMFEGSYAIVRWIILVPISIGILIMLSLTVIQIIRGS
jgi:hypothetical protein